MTRTSWLLLGLALLLLAQAAAGAATEGQPDRYITVDFRDAPLDDVLRSVFRETPYTFTLGPGLEDLRLTITLNEVTFRQALRAITGMHDLLYEKEGNVYHIYRRPQAEIEAREEAARKAYEEAKRE
jgi:type II secretory pathway component GspD/PulD (secretin)